MIVRRSMHPGYLSNSYLVADHAGGSALLIDAGAPIEPLVRAANELDVKPSHLLITHGHHDHTEHAVELRELWGLDELDAEQLADGQQIEVGKLRIRVLDSPGHCSPHAAFLINDEALFSGDALFAGSVGGTMGGGPDGFAQLQHTIMDVFMTLPHETVVYPGHTDATTIGAEWNDNPFVRIWRSADARGAEPVSVRGNAATLILESADYDGGTKGWVQFADGHEAIVGGSMLARPSAV